MHNCGEKRITEEEKLKLVRSLFDLSNMSIDLIYKDLKKREICYDQFIEIVMNFLIRMSVISIENLSKGTPRPVSVDVVKAKLYNDLVSTILVNLQRGAAQEPPTTQQ